ncbi:MAG: DUF3800 domain-containing protein [Gammaproteobacteria bacterium]|nr:DUF3800 domain-containing protein [Gammaproteobacteria bacterium]
MYLIYFDENKYSKESPYFFIGGILLEDKKLTEFESTIMQIQYNFFGTNILTKDTELHGIDIFQGKGSCKNKKLDARIALIQDVAKFIVTNKIPIRLVCIDVEKHRKKYAYPQPEYNLGLMLILERFCDYLEQINDIGIVFGDYEKDEITHSILDFSQFKLTGKTPMNFGRPLGHLKDTIYFTHSHHSRFLQVADIILYLANRFEHNHKQITKWHEIEAQKAWNELKNRPECLIQTWP